jgi:hypothetical protein
MNEPAKSWKEQKAERDAYADSQLKRIFTIRRDLCKPGDLIRTVDGTTYEIAKDGSRRRVKQSV